MLEFDDSGLPNTQNIQRAFNTLARSEEHIGNVDHVLRMAKILLAAAPAREDLVVLALLSYMPDVTLGILGRRFGDEAQETLKQMSAHMRTGYAYVEDANANVKALATASSIAYLDEFDTGIDKIVQRVQDFRAAGSRAIPDITPPITPNVRALDHIAKVAWGQTGSGDLDWMLVDKIQHFRMTVEEKLAMLGKEPPQEIKFPAFADTGLMDDPKVRSAYDMLTTNARVQPQGFAKALATGAVLSAASPGLRNPTAIAAGLLDLGLGTRGAADISFLQNRVDWDVMELIGHYNVQEIPSVGKLLRAPVEVKQVAVAHSIVSIERALNEGKQAFEIFASGKIDANLVPVLKDSAISQLRSLAKKSADVVAPVAGMAEAPALKALFDEQLDTLNKFISANAPKPMLLLPAPKPEPKPEKSKGFNL